MKLLLLVIAGFLAVSTNAAGGFALETTTEPVLKEPDLNGPASREPVSKKHISKQAILVEPLKEAILKEPWEEPVSNEQWKEPALQRNVGSLHQTKMSDWLPYPLNMLIRTFGKDVLRNLDVESFCDTIQLLDWKKYKKLLEVEDFIGFKDTITQDEILSAALEAFQETTVKYVNKMGDTLTKALKIEDLDTLESNIDRFIDIISVNLGVRNNTIEGVQNNMNSKVGNTTIDKKSQRQALENLQDNINKLLELLSTSTKTQNSFKVSKKMNLSGYSKGSPA